MRRGPVSRRLQQTLADTKAGSNMGTLVHNEPWLVEFNCLCGATTTVRGTNSHLGSVLVDVTCHCGRKMKAKQPTQEWVAFREMPIAETGESNE